MLHDANPEIRTDVLTGQRVIIAPIRSQRPSAVIPDAEIPQTADPFAEGCESETPSERFAVRSAASAPDEPGWTLRVVPNRFPATVPFESIPSDNGKADTASKQIEKLFPSEAAVGEHDVVIECPDSRSRLTELSVEEVTQVLKAWRTRVHQLASSGQHSSIAVFRNEGFSAGASLRHAHSQIIASKLLTSLDARRHREAAKHAADTGRDLTSDLLQAERADGSRIIHIAERFTVLCPFAPRTSWHIRFVPNDGCLLSFADAHDDALIELATLLKTSLTSLETAIGTSFSYNLILPHPRIDQPPTFRWILDLLPRTGRIAGWELLSGVDIVTVTPEHSAGVLRSLFGHATGGFEL